MTSLRVLLLFVPMLMGCRCRGETKVGDKRAFACAEVPARDAHREIDLGDGKRLVVEGVRASFEPQSGAEDAPAAVTSFDGGASELAIPAGTAAVFVVGLGGLRRELLSEALAALTKVAPLVVAVVGPEDEVDQARAAMSDAGSHVVDGSVVRAFAFAGLEILTLPGSDDPSALAEHGRGCVVRIEDVRALLLKVGAPASGRPRIAMTFSAPSRNPERPTAADALSDTSAWLIGGPLDRDVSPNLEIAAGTHAPLIPIPRALSPRTTSTPGLIPPGFILMHGVGRSADARIQITRASR